jgi:hypothetical protein
LSGWPRTSAVYRSRYNKNLFDIGSSGRTATDAESQTTSLGDRCAKADYQ